jgi:hypothetical protein
MNRKLQHSMMALSVTATVFSVLLLASGPATVPAAQALPLAVVAIATAPLAAAELPDAASQPQLAAGAQRHLRRSRATLALPYFSFAQGLRHGRS